MRDSWAQTIQDTVLPTLRGHEGFAGYIGLVGKPISRSKAWSFSTLKRTPRRPNKPCKNDAGK
jgi:hypothetical protein